MSVSNPVATSAGSLSRLRGELRARLEARLPEIEEAIRIRVYGIADPNDADPSYLEGLRASVPLALDYALEAIERGEESAPAPPPALLAQARMAARNAVGLHTVLRRYVAGYSLLGDFLAEEAAAIGLRNGSASPQLLRGQAALFDRLLAVISEEYQREIAGRLRSSEQRRVERVQRLLDGERLDLAELRYQLDAWHLAAIAVGPGAPAALRDLARALNRDLLLVSPEGQATWAWLGGRAILPTPDALHAAEDGLPVAVTLALGEPGKGVEGWRLTHRQAAAAMPVAIRGEAQKVRYADVALLATGIRDELLVTFLRRVYLAPLDRERDSGETLRATLAAYFSAGQNASSAAAVLGVSRKTVALRLRAVEDRIGTPLDHCARELQTALELRRLQDGDLGADSPHR